MPSAVKIPLPSGSIGVRFKGSPAEVTGLQDDSPLLGKVKVGYTVDSLYLPDGSIHKDIGTAELIKLLKAHSDSDKGRKLKLKMSTTETSGLVIPAGKEGVEVTGKPPRVSGLSDDFKDCTHRIGLAVDVVEIEDGTKYCGHSAEEIVDLLAENIDSKITLHFLRPSQTRGSPHEVILPLEKSVDLPAAEKLGIGFAVKNGVTTLTKLSSESPLRGSARVGMAIDALSLEGGDVMHLGFSGSELRGLLGKTADDEKRQFILKGPSNQSITKKSSTIVKLPAGNASDLGLDFTVKGTMTAKALVYGIAEDSPLKGKVQRGQEVVSVGLDDGLEYDELPTDELLEILQESSDAADKSRFMMLLNGDEPLIDEVTVTLPAGKLGINFIGSPPRINKIIPGSPLQDKVFVGMVVDTLTLKEPEEVLYNPFTAKEFINLLVEQKDSDQRVLRLINPATREFSTPDLGSLPEEVVIDLPAVYPLGFAMVDKKDGLCHISSVRRQSPLRTEMDVGMCVDELLLPDGTRHIQRSAAEMRSLLKDTTEVEGRKLTLKNPETGTFSTLPDKTEIVLPTGRLGVTFSKTAPPTVIALKDDSPIKDDVMLGMYVDMFTLSDGTAKTGLSTPELTAELNATVNEEDRLLLLKNPRSSEPRPYEVILPDETTVVLPTGTLGISFRETRNSMCVVTRVHETSKMKNVVRVGMAVDILAVSAEQVYSGLTAKEICRVLAETKGVAGRKLTLKNPDTARMSTRNVIVDDDGEFSTVNGDQLFDDESQRG